MFFLSAERDNVSSSNQVVLFLGCSCFLVVMNLFPERVGEATVDGFAPGSQSSVREGRRRTMHRCIMVFFTRNGFFEPF